MRFILGLAPLALAAVIVALAIGFFYLTGEREALFFAGLALAIILLLSGKGAFRRKWD